MKYGADAKLRISEPGGEGADVEVEIKRTVEPRDVLHIAQTFERFGGEPWLVIAPYISERTQELLRAGDICYADLTGNIYFTARKPAIFIHDRGATSDPWRETQPIYSLRGPTSGRVVRGLCDLSPPYGIRELATQIAAPPSSVSRVVTLLTKEGFVVRTDDGEIDSVDWQGLLQRWAQDYGFMRSNHTYRYIEPRGLTALMYGVEELGITWDRKYAITGTLAAAQVAPSAPSHLFTIYAESATRFATELELRPAQVGANVLIAEPFDSVVFDRTWEKGGCVYAALSQVTADLLTSPGRGPAEGMELMRWMGEHEDAWRQ
jgi:hypothetical protein